MRVKAILASLTVFGGFAATAMNWPSSVPVEPAHPVTLAGLTWLGSLNEAIAIAAQENKPVLHLQIFGRLDDAFC